MESSINISLPRPLKKWVDRQTAAGGYGTADKFLHELLRRAQASESREKIDAKLIEALDSGESTPMTAADWKRIRAAGRRRFMSRRAK